MSVIFLTTSLHLFTLIYGQSYSQLISTTSLRFFFSTLVIRDLYNIFVPFFLYFIVSHVFNYILAPFFLNLTSVMLSTTPFCVFFSKESTLILLLYLVAVSLSNGFHSYFQLNHLLFSIFDYLFMLWISTLLNFIESQFKR